MKISIEEISSDQEEEVLIRCHEVDDEINGILTKLSEEDLIVLGYDSVLEVKMKLYDLEDACRNKNGFRASKSTILNLAKIASVHPSISGRFQAVLDNGERVVISRQYRKAKDRTDKKRQQKVTKRLGGGGKSCIANKRHVLSLLPGDNPAHCVMIRVDLVLHKLV